MTRPRAADDFSAIRERLEEFRRERSQRATSNREAQPDDQTMTHNRDRSGLFLCLNAVPLSSRAFVIGKSKLQQ